jgi:hypothetical protein
MESPLVYLVILGALAGWLTTVAGRWRLARGERPGLLDALAASSLASFLVVLFMSYDDLALIGHWDGERWTWIAIFALVLGVLAFIASLGVVRFYRSESIPPPSVLPDPEAHLLIARTPRSFFRRCVCDNALSLTFGAVLWIQAIVTRVSEPNLEGFGSGGFWFGMGCVCLSPFTAYLFVAFITRVTKPRTPVK